MVVIKHFWNFLIEKRKKIFEDSLVHVGDHTVSSETITLFRSLLDNTNWSKIIRETVFAAISD